MIHRRVLHNSVYFQQLAFHIHDVNEEGATELLF